VVDGNGVKRKKSKLQVEFKKCKTLIYDVEVEEATEAYLINMNKYFQIYEYDDNLKEMLEIYQLQGKSTLWWCCGQQQTPFLFSTINNTK